MQIKAVRDYSKRGDALPIPNLVQVQQDAYRRFIQNEKAFDKRDTSLGLESLLKEVFPIVSYDGNMRLEYLYYKLDEPRYTPEECKEILKDMMLREYDRTQAEKYQTNWKALASWLQNQSSTYIRKFWNRAPTEPTIGIEELSGTIRSRHI